MIETERQRERETERDRQTERERLTDRERERERERKRVKFSIALIIYGYEIFRIVVNKIAIISLIFGLKWERKFSFNGI